ncbi:MAG: hypothetical protein AAF211_19830 [Myxococcota bacterium]
MSRWVVWGLVAGCGMTDAGRRAPTTLTCPEGTTLRDTGPDAPLDDRVQPGTRVLQCLDAQGRPTGKHLERYPGEPGGVAVEGEWTEGRAEGAWSVWRPDGAFARRFEVTGDRPAGEWLDVTTDGRVTAITFAEGVVVRLRTLPANTSMPEWDEGVQTEGRRYRSQP